MKKFDLRAKQIHLSAVRAQVSEWGRNVKIVWRVGMFGKDDQVWESRIHEIKKAYRELSVESIKCLGKLSFNSFNGSEGLNMILNLRMPFRGLLQVSLFELSK
jgi:hypothetical protein